MIQAYYPVFVAGAGSGITGAINTVSNKFSFNANSGLLSAGPIYMYDTELSRPKITDYGVTLNSKGTVSGNPVDIDLTLGNVVTATINGATTFTFSNPPATGIGGGFLLILTNGGSATINWPTGTKWASATAPTLTASGTDVLQFVTTDTGTTWYDIDAALNAS